MELRELLESMKRNCIRLTIETPMEQQLGSSRFGGTPDVPEDFIWLVFETDSFDDDQVKPRPLAFLAQFNCAELAALDTEELLPKTGLLSFFYEIDSSRWGYDPADAGCTRVYWFAQVDNLKAAAYPADLPEDYRFPCLKIEARADLSLPDWQDFELQYGNLEADGTQQRGGKREIELDYDGLAEEKVLLGHEGADGGSQLLGWPFVIQNNMTRECELVSRGHYLGGLWEKIPQQDIEEATKNSLDKWLLLFQLDTVTSGDFELMFGDCGLLYFYIRREDLAKRDFSRVWVILQCY